MKKSFYDDPSFSYPKYWEKRRYEHLSEIIALRKLIEKIPHDKRGDLIDVGAGFAVYFTGSIKEIIKKSQEELKRLEKFKI